MAASKTHCNVTPTMLDSVLIGRHEGTTWWPLEQILGNEHRNTGKPANRPD